MKALMIYSVVFIGIIAAAVCVYQVKRLFARYRGDKLSKAMNAKATHGDRFELDALQEKMDEATEKLKASAGLYALPWIMMIGPPSAGKSTLLRNSDLNFPSSVNQPITLKGFGETQNCDWWFADEAVILDTAGRYTLEESDRQEWIGLLHLLRKDRKRSPLNGIVVTLSMEDLIAKDKPGLHHQVHLIRQQIDEIYQQLGVRVPIQCVITQCDRIAGFSSFFADLDQESREQAWGLQHGLIDALAERRLQKLPINPLLENKLEIMKFPSEFQKALEKVSFLMEGLMKKSHFQEQPDFRGVYFTSALQKLKPESQGSVRSYFIKDLFRKFIFQQVTLSKNAHMKKQQARWVWATVAFCSVCVIAVALFLQGGYELQKELYAQESSVLRRLNKGNQTAAYQRFEQTQRIYQHYAYLKTLESKGDWRFRIGINSLDTEIKNLETLFVDSFAQTHLPLAQQALKESLNRDTKAWAGVSAEQRAKHYARFYDHLKATLMLTDMKKLEPAFLARVLSSSMGDQEPMFLAFLKAVKARPSLLVPVRIDSSSVKAAREALVSKPDSKILYQLLVSRGIDELGFASLQELTQGKDQGMLTQSHPMPKMYTPAAFEKTVLPMMKSIAENAGSGDWVLHEEGLAKPDKKTQQKWVKELRAFYFQDYANHWIQWIGSLQMKSFHSLDDAATKLARLQKEEGPISAVILAVESNLKLDAPELKQTSQGFRGADEAVAAYLKQVATLQADLTTLSSSSDPHRDAELYARKVFANSADSSLSLPLQALSGVETMGNPQKQALSALLRSPVEQSWRAILNAAALHLQQAWEAEVIEPYNHSLRGKFPFARTHLEVALDDVTSFFNPSSGQLPQFHERFLQPYLKQTKGVWQEQEWLGQGIGFSKAFLTAIAQGDVISHALFKSKSSEPEFSFYIQPMPVPGIEEVVFDSNGQQYRYRNEPEEWRRFTWPGDASQIGARLFVSTTKQGGTAEIEHHGLWGLFHLLSDAKFVKQGGIQYLTEWQLRDKSGQSISAKIRMKADKQGNVLDPHVLMQFKLPEQIRHHAAG